MNYAPRPYYRVTMNRKRQIIDAMVNDLHEQYFDMIEQALEHSVQQQAREVIEDRRHL